VLEELGRSVSVSSLLSVSSSALDQSKALVAAVVAMRIITKAHVASITVVRPLSIGDVMALATKLVRRREMNVQGKAIQVR
jgi:hypothetical protein